MRGALDQFSSMTYGVLRWARNIGLSLILAVPTVAVAEQVTIAALGDSLTAGYGLPAADGFVPQLQGWLDTQGVDTVVINAGVSGDTTAGGVSRVAWTLTPDVDKMIVNLGGNDLLRGIDPAVSRANLDEILRTAQAQDVDVLLVGLDAPGNYGPEYETAFDAMYPELAQEYGVIYYPDFFAPLIAVAGQDGARQRYMQSDNLHPSAEGVALIVGGIGPIVLELIAQ
jgi:acyl-CoA thioesterase-1